MDFRCISNFLSSQLHVCNHVKFLKTFFVFVGVPCLMLYKNCNGVSCHNRQVPDNDTLFEKCPNPELFWSVFSRIRTRITPNKDTIQAVITNIKTEKIQQHWNKKEIKQNHYRGGSRTSHYLKSSCCHQLTGVSQSSILDVAEIQDTLLYYI